MRSMQIMYLFLMSFNATFKEWKPCFSGGIAWNFSITNETFTLFQTRNIYSAIYTFYIWRNCFILKNLNVTRCDSHMHYLGCKCPFEFLTILFKHIFKWHSHILAKLGYLSQVRQATRDLKFYFAIYSEGTRTSV